MKPLPKKYNHKEAEARWQKYWEEQGVYHWDDSQPRDKTFVIDTPPPTVSGVLHMGHIFSYTQADFVARYQRMSGKTVFYPMGFDDNGLPTERLVEKVRKIRASDMTREEFITVCEEVVEEAEEEFRRLFKEVALSVDWNQEYQTISEESRKISQLSFLDLFHKQKAYRKLQPMLWDPVDRTALAQAEIEDKNFESHMNDVKFTTEDGEDAIIATTRPELIPACVAVLFHPEDPRYLHLKGKHAVTALFGAKVPFIEDELVDMDKGTGLVMCCTFGDETDIAWWQKHDLPTRVVLDHYGRLSHMEKMGSEDWPVVDIEKCRSYIAELNGKKVKAARQQMLEWLEQEKLLLKSDPIEHVVKCAERSGAPLEILPTYQWFIHILDVKEELLEKVRECNWHPDFMRIRCEQWIEGLNWDWCISRQRYFGVPFPVWYVSKPFNPGGQATIREVIVPDKEDLPVNPLTDLPKGFERTNAAEEDAEGRMLAVATADYVNAKGVTVFKKGDAVAIQPEVDVMDTWATSSVSPQLSSKAVTEEFAVDYERHTKLFPADLRPQAHEIIRSWAFYTIVKAYLHEGSIPWKDLMISGWCLAEDKSKMSKSKGNVVTPVALIEEKGSDVVRFWASTSRLGADTAYSEDVLKVGKKLVTKLWNATKFASLHLDKLGDERPVSAAKDVKSGVVYEPIDLWVLTRLNKTVKKATEEFEKFEYCNARTAVEGFFWNDFCDNYLEIIKVRSYGEAEDVSKEAQMSAVHTVYHCVDTFLRLFAPIVPHITDELYSHIFEDKFEQLGGSLHMCGTWPKVAAYPLDKEAEQAGIACVEVLDTVRKMKAERSLSLKAPIEVLDVTFDKAGTGVRKIGEDLARVCNAAEVRFTEGTGKGIFKEKEGYDSAISDDRRFAVNVKFVLQEEEPAA